MKKKNCYHDCKNKDYDKKNEKEKRRLNYSITNDSCFVHIIDIQVFIENILKNYKKKRIFKKSKLPLLNVQLFYCQSVEKY